MLPWQEIKRVRREKDQNRIMAGAVSIFRYGTLIKQNAGKFVPHFCII